MSNQPEVGRQSQLPTGNGIVDLTEEELGGVNGGGLIRSVGRSIAEGAKIVVKGAKSAGDGIAKGAKATWKIIY